MDLKTLNYSIAEAVPVYQMKFSPNTTGWEIVDSKTERAALGKQHYYMENRGETRWVYYKQKFPEDTGSDWIIDTKIEILNPSATGHFGLVWGFSKSREIVNRFTISGDTERCLIMQFQKDHQRVYYRHQYNELETDAHSEFRLTIIRTQSWFHFLVNKKLVHIAHRSAFAELGPYFGYYLEPEVSIRSSYITVKKLLSVRQPENGYAELLDQY